VGARDIRIRRAELGDAPALSDAWLEFGRYYATLEPDRFQEPARHGLTQWVQEQIRAADASKVWLVAERGGEFAGYVKARLRVPDSEGDRQVLRDASCTMLGVDVLVVMEKSRRLGIGTALIRAAEAWGKERGAEGIFLWTSANSPSAVPFYRSLGYEPSSLGFRSELD
jgi:GNAT superfamily N-acetyltransferase